MDHGGGEGFFLYKRIELTILPVNPSYTHLYGYKRSSYSFLSDHVRKYDLTETSVVIRNNDAIVNGVNADP